MVAVGAIRADAAVALVENRRVGAGRVGMVVPGQRRGVTGLLPAALEGDHLRAGCIDAAVGAVDGEAVERVADDGRRLAFERSLGEALLDQRMVVVVAPEAGVAFAEVDDRVVDGVAIVVGRCRLIRAEDGDAVDRHRDHAKQRDGGERVGVFWDERHPPGVGLGAERVGGHGHELVADDAVRLDVEVVGVAVGAEHGVGVGAVLGRRVGLHKELVRAVVGARVRARVGGGVGRWVRVGGGIRRGIRVGRGIRRAAGIGRCVGGGVSLRARVGHAAVFGARSGASVCT